MPETEIYYTTKEAAEILEVHPITIGDWIRNGDITAEKSNPLRLTSPYRIPKSQVDKILELRKRGSQATALGF